MKNFILCCILISYGTLAICDSVPQCFKLKFGEISCKESIGVNTVVKTIPAKNDCLDKKKGNQMFEQLDGLKKLIKSQGVDAAQCRKLEGKLKSQIETVSKQAKQIKDLQKTNSNLQKTNSKLTNDLKKCEAVPKDICRLPKIIGMCRAAHPYWYFDIKSGSCKKFIYGGCGGNENRFARQNECLAKCKHYIKEPKKVVRTHYSNAKLRKCGVGLQDRNKIKDSQFSSSTRYNCYHQPAYSRLFSKRGWGSWVPTKSQQNSNQWLQVDLGRDRTITGIATQGNQRGVFWVKLFRLEYRTSSSSTFKPIADTKGRPVVFDGNRDPNSPVVNIFASPITARYFRIRALKWQGYYITIRWELLVC